jgi:hypothetical protein
MTAQQNFTSLISNEINTRECSYKAPDINGFSLPTIPSLGSLEHYNVNALLGFNHRIWIVITPRYDLRQVWPALNIESLAKTIKAKYFSGVGDTQLCWFFFEPEKCFIESPLRLYSITHLTSISPKCSYLREAGPREIEYIDIKRLENPESNNYELTRLSNVSGIASH